MLSQRITQLVLLLSICIACGRVHTNPVNSVAAGFMGAGLGMMAGTALADHHHRHHYHHRYKHMHQPHSTLYVRSRYSAPCNYHGKCHGRYPCTRIYTCNSRPSCHYYGHPPCIYPCNQIPSCPMLPPLIFM